MVAYNPFTKEVITVIQQENTNTQTNISLIKEIVKANPDRKKIKIRLDNASMNKSKELFDFIKQQNVKIELIFQAPYSPHLNLIERLWKFSKRNSSQINTIQHLLNSKMLSLTFLKQK